MGESAEPAVVIAARHGSFLQHLDPLEHARVQVARAQLSKKMSRHAGFGGDSSQLPEETSARGILATESASGG